MPRPLELGRPEEPHINKQKKKKYLLKATTNPFKTTQEDKASSIIIRARRAGRGTKGLEYPSLGNVPQGNIDVSRPPC